MKPYGENGENTGPGENTALASWLKHKILELPFNYTTNRVQRGLKCNHKWNPFRPLRSFSTFF